MANINSSRETKSLAELPSTTQSKSLPEAAEAVGGTSNAEQVEKQLVSLSFSTEKSGPLLPSCYATKSGGFTYSSVRAGLSETHPELSGDAKTKMVNSIMNSKDATALAAVMQLYREGYRVSRFNGRQLKSGTRTVSIGMNNARDKKAEPAKKIEDYTAAELREMADLREKASGAKTLDVVPA